MKVKVVLVCMLVMVMTLCMTSFPVWAAPDRDAWNRQVAEIDALYQEKNFSKVMEKTKNFLAWTRHQFGKSHPNVAEALSMTAKLHFHHNQREKVEGMLQEALAIREQVYGREHPKTVDSLEALSAFYIADERMDDAEPVLQATLEGRRHQLGADHPRLAEYLENSARSYQRLKRLDQAETLFREALALRERLPGSESNKRDDALTGLAEVSAERGDIAQAETWYQRAMQAIGTEGEANRLRRAQILDQQGIMLWRIGQEARARQLQDQAVQEAYAVYGRDPARLAVWLSNLGRLHYKSGDYQRATSLLNQALDNVLKQYGNDPSNSQVQAIRRNLETLNRGAMLAQKSGPVHSLLGTSENQKAQGPAVRSSPSHDVKTGPVARSPGVTGGHVKDIPGISGPPRNPVVTGEVPTGDVESSEVAAVPHARANKPTSDGGDFSREIPQVPSSTMVPDAGVVSTQVRGSAGQDVVVPLGVQGTAERIVTQPLPADANRARRDLPAADVSQATRELPPIDVSQARRAPPPIKESVNKEQPPAQGWREVNDNRAQPGGQGPGRLPRRGDYFVSTGCFGDSEFLTVARDRLKRLALPGFLTQANLHSGKLTCVFVGPYTGESDARRALARLGGEGGGLSGLEIRQASKDW
ncbi:MAG: tetratricopeptide repeat protein [Magnetococcales bacterium]|nr:tetratricopeptide repeat protein [Magnetococcales bacterium]